MKTIANSRKEAFFESEKGHGYVVFLSENQGWEMSYEIKPYFELKQSALQQKQPQKRDYMKF